MLRKRCAIVTGQRWTEAIPGTRCWVGPAVALQLTTDRTRRPLQAARNYPQRAALLKAQLDQRAFFTAQVFVVRSHGNTLSPDKCCTSYLRPPGLLVHALGNKCRERRVYSPPMAHGGYLLIADISGYTEFFKLHNLRKMPVIGGKIADGFEAHAETIISDLLEAVIGQIEPVMSLNKLEGDAAFFFCEDDGNGSKADDIIGVMERAHEAFKEKASELVFVQACGCEPCLQSKNLRLKIVAHKGEFAIKKIRQFEEIAGEAVILVHRLLKNSLKNNEYWLLTDAFAEHVSANHLSDFSKIIEIVENFAKMTLNCLEFSSPEPENAVTQSRSRTYNWGAQFVYFAKASMKRRFTGKSELTPPRLSARNFWIG